MENAEKELFVGVRAGKVVRKFPLCPFWPFFFKLGFKVESWEFQGGITRIPGWNYHSCMVEFQGVIEQIQGGVPIRKGGLNLGSNKAQPSKHLKLKDYPRKRDNPSFQGVSSLWLAPPCTHSSSGRNKGKQGEGTGWGDGGGFEGILTFSPKQRNFPAPGTAQLFRLGFN